MLYYSIFLLIVNFDQASKYIISNSFKLYQSLPIIDNVFHITYVRNYGGAFGILQNFQLLFILANSVVMIVILFYFIISKNESKILRLSLTLIFSGGVGNLNDRISYGYVIDFLDFRIWPVFNIADCSIVIGAILLSIYILFIYKYNKSSKEV